MSFKKFLATSVLAFATVTGTVAQAEPGEQALFQALDQAGVEYTLGECAPHGIENTYGFYHPEKNWIHICSDVATTEEQVFQTLRHEAVHASQACVNPSMSFTVTSSQYLMENGRQSDWEFIQRAYDKEDWAIELEAFTLMRFSNQAIADLVNSTCN